MVDAERPELEEPGLAVEQAGEDAGRVEARHAEPVDRPVRSDQRTRVAVREERVVGDRRERRRSRRALRARSGLGDGGLTTGPRGRWTRRRGGCSTRSRAESSSMSVDIPRSFRVGAGPDPIRPVAGSPTDGHTNPSRARARVNLETTGSGRGPPQGGSRALSRSGARRARWGRSARLRRSAPSCHDAGAPGASRDAYPRPGARAAGSRASGSLPRRTGASRVRATRETRRRLPHLTSMPEEPDRPPARPTTRE